MRPVTINYNKSMLPYFKQGIEEMQNEGLEFSGLSMEVIGEKLVIIITIEQQERYLIQLGIKVGKAFAKDSIPK